MKIFTTELKQTIVLEPRQYSEGHFLGQSCPHTEKAQNFCAHPKNQKVGRFFWGVFGTQKNYSCGGRVPPNKLPSTCIQKKKAFEDLSQARPASWGKKQDQNRQYSEGQLFGSKFAPTQKKKTSPHLQMQGRSLRIV